MSTMEGKDIEIVKPDPEIREMTKRIMEQNDKILEMNRMLLRYLANPMVVIPPDKENPT